MKPSGVETGWSAQQRVLVFTACIFLLFMPAGLYTSRHHAQKSNSLQLVAVKGMNVPHPILALMAEAEETYRNVLSKQSKTLVDAVNEYRRRYGREPPRGFGDWWKFAVENNVMMVDEYDGMVEDLAPFWELPGEELRRRAAQVGNLPTIGLVRVRDGKAVLLDIENGDSEDKSRAEFFAQLIGRFQSKVGRLPDMDFPINTKPQGRVLVPWEHRQFPNMTAHNSSVGIDAMLGGKFTARWGSTGNVWEAFRRTCHPHSQARRTNPVKYSDPTGFSSESGDDFHFPQTLDSEFNFCSNPSAHFNHGHFFSNWRTISALYPVFSNSKAPGYSDIRIPSHYYYNPTAKYSYAWDYTKNVTKGFDDMEIPWQHKHNTIFWRGSTMGGGSTPARFAPTYHRYRQAVVFPDPPNSSSYEQANVPITKLNHEIMDVAFTNWTGEDHYPGGREAVMKAYRFTDPVPLGQNWKYKYLVDIDGKGYSARFPAFLASDSAVIKSTVYSEYFSDWIQPWLHYIPLSQGYHEIYNIFSFFSGPTASMLHTADSSVHYDDPIVRKAEDGDRRLRRIAQAGKEWKRTVGRTIDMEVFVYRLCLEWGRLWADDRDSMNFTSSGLSS
ncbi:capsular associated protein [Rickenella mellea]|uniref:Capsular associated protein n=1 Tax=Rickenella mellea TaxID=50990 RepID=A0A4Y7PJ75_9AGAM|nr:capsular associated protein [Rickenella mellea]